MKRPVGLIGIAWDKEKGSSLPEDNADWTEPDQQI